MRALLFLVTLALLAGCQAQPMPPRAPVPSDLPIRTAPELADLSFMSGRWIAVLPAGSVAEEYWMPARGNTMMGMFRVVPAFNEPEYYGVLSIIAEPGGVMFRMRPYRGQLDELVDGSETKVYRLTGVEAGRATFTPLNRSSVVSITYTASGPNQLIVETEFEPGASEPTGQTVYTRDPQ